MILHQEAVVSLFEEDLIPVFAEESFLTAILLSLLSLLLDGAFWGGVFPPEGVSCLSFTEDTDVTDDVIDDDVTGD